ncbi:M48 family metalloprotease [Nocardia higoensis]|uniref:M48 family metalloprotease n=1 Tax=Nocardia higoensis TaxID=228599 RepID=A0ABS0DF74_9NOCA|nr:M48 family metalloprotease [Nocardia higoensis]MBF6356252.1 M48 family metalloprotease [Nocardia higoensis]
MSVIVASVLTLPTVLLSLLIAGTAGALWGSWAVLAVGGAWLLYGVVLVWVAWYAPEREKVATILHDYRRPDTAEALRLDREWRTVAADSGVPGEHYPLWVQDTDRVSAHAAPVRALAVTTWALEHLPPAQIRALLAQSLGQHAGADPRLRLCREWCAWPGTVLWRLFGLLGKPLDVLGAYATPVRVVLTSLLLPALLLIFGHRLALPGIVVLAVMLAVEPLARAAYSREAESAADRYAVAIGYGPALSAALRTWSARHEPRVPPLLRRLLSHRGSPTVRLRAIERGA